MIQIDNMEMPKSCGDCPLTFCDAGGYYCGVNENAKYSIDVNDTERDSRCPLKEVTNNEAEKTLEHIQRIVDDYSYDKAKGWWNIQQALRQYGEYKKYKEQKGEST